MALGQKVAKGAHQEQRAVASRIPYVETHRAYLFDVSAAVAGDRTFGDRLTSHFPGPERGAPFAASGFPDIVFSNAARTAGSPPSWLRRDMMPKIVLPHWLNATKLWKHSKTTKAAPLLFLGGWSFSREVSDCIDEDRIEHKSAVVDSWEAALKLLDQYPWCRLFPVRIHRSPGHNLEQGEFVGCASGRRQLLQGGAR
jgi:hypothetical protein